MKALPFFAFDVADVLAVTDHSNLTTICVVMKALLVSPLHEAGAQILILVIQLINSQI